jgi:nicotinamidase-related amidase
MDAKELITSSEPFLTWLVDWHNHRPAGEMEEILAGAGDDPARIVVIAVDVTRGFCCEGPLASERVGGIVPGVVHVFQRAHDLGVRHFLLPQDTHSEEAVEFEVYPPHAMAGSAESETVPALTDLPFSDLFRVMEKDTISSNLNTELGPWLDAHPEVTTYLVVGDCTDLCVYQLAMHLRLRANAHKIREARVIVPIDAVDTFHTPVDVAAEIGAMPHHADLLHLIFLYSMAQNGVEIVAEVI